MGNPASDVAKLHREFTGQLTLDGEVERVDDVRPEVWIQAFPCASSDGIKSRKVGLR